MKLTIQKRWVGPMVALWIGTAQIALAQVPGPCSLADINQALSSDLTCSTAGTVFFGTDITTFVQTQCAGISHPGEDPAALKMSQEACIRCAKQAGSVFQAAKRAKLLPADADSRLSVSAVKQLCNISETGGDGGGSGDQPPPSDALQSLYNQLRGCFPTPGQTVDAGQCVQCASALLDGALAGNVINQAKYTVMKQSVQQVCSHQGGGSGDGEKPREPAPSPAPTPGAGDGPPDPFVQSVIHCLEQFHSTANFNPDQCAACVNAVPTDGVDPQKVSTVLPYARNACQKPLEQH